jgi:UMF1 family MFS transporter
LLTLGVCLVYINLAEGLGHGATQYVPVTLVITAVMFALAATPTFVWLKERAVVAPSAGSRPNYIVTGFREVRRTLGQARQFRDLFAFLTALVVIQAGVSTVIVVAAIYAQEVLDFDTAELVQMVMVVNLTAAAGALLGGHLQDRWGSIPAMVTALLIWIAAVVLVLGARTDNGIWLAANLIGLAMGTGQAVGRALVGQLTPVERTAEFFGLWGFANRLAAILGPVSYGFISFITAGNHRLAVLSTLVYFVLGLVLLSGVDESRGKRAAEDATAR